MQRHVVRIGLRLQCRISDLLEVGARLESAGFSSRERFQVLTDDVARDLCVPRHLAEALRADSLQNSRVRPGRAELGLTDQQVEIGIGHVGWRPSHSPPVSSTYGSKHGIVKIALPLRGIPSAVCDYEPERLASPRRSLSPLRRPASASEEGALQTHLSRATSAREARDDTFDMRISNVRHDPSPCREHHALKRRSGSPVLGTSRDRSLAGRALWTHMKELTSDISPTYIGGPYAPEYQRDYGWGTDLSSPNRTPRTTLRSQCQPPA